MPDFRYAQFCPLARAAEILGERWTLLVLRELVFGPKRFADLRRGLPGVSSSVLSERLTRLEERGIVARRILPPPAAVPVYELSGVGRELEPVIGALARWGSHFLEAPRPGDLLTPQALRLGLHFLSRGNPAPECRIAVVADDGQTRESFRIVGGPGGVQVLPGESPADVTLRGHPFALAGLVAGLVDPAQAERNGAVQVEGDAAVLARLPDLFDLRSPGGSGLAGSTHPGGSEECPS